MSEDTLVVEQPEPTAPAETITEEAKRRGVSRQYVWQQRQAAKGNCRRCGQKREQYPYFCDDCQELERNEEWERYGACLRRNGPYGPRSVESGDEPKNESPAPEQTA